MKERDQLSVCAFFGGLMDKGKALAGKPIDFLFDVVGLERNMMKALAFGGQELGDGRVGVTGFEEFNFIGSYLKKAVITPSLATDSLL